MIRTIGIDLGKTSVHLIAMDWEGTIVLRKRLSRPQLFNTTANIPVCLIAMEASCGAHYLGRLLTAQGHEVKLIPAQFVRPFVKSNKNDYIDAEAIAEAALSVRVGICGLACINASTTFDGRKNKTARISKRGNEYLRRLFIRGARSVLRQSKRGRLSMRAWLTQLEVRAHPNVAVVALANKLARIAWAILATGARYRIHSPAAVV